MSLLLPERESQASFEAHCERECAHEDSAERARTMCALRVGERFTV